MKEYAAILPAEAAAEMRRARVNERALYLAMRALTAIASPYQDLGLRRSGLSDEMQRKADEALRAINALPVDLDLGITIGPEGAP